MRVPSGLPQGPGSALLVAPSLQGLPPRKVPRAGPSDIVVIILLPWVVFTLVVGLFMVSYQDFSPLVWALVASAGLMALLFVSMGAASGKAAQLALGLLVLTAVGVAVPVGLYLEYSYMAEYCRIDSGAEYRRVSPAAPGAAFGDASVLEFEQGSYVDLEKSLGFMQLGDVFCVAPILGPGALMPEGPPHFWAAGRDCCNQRGSFRCADVGKVGTHSGVIVEDGTHAFHSAARMAAAANELPTPAEPLIFVRWTADPAAYKEKLFSSALTLAATASGLHFLGSVFAGALLSRSLLR